MKKINFIASICNHKKLGLKDHALALEYYGNMNDSEREYLLVKNFFHLIHIFFLSKRENKYGLFLIWDNSIRSLLLGLISRALGFTLVYYYHEPGGLNQKLLKKDPLIYSFKAALGEWLFQKIAHYSLVARLDKVSAGYVFCPLLFDDRRPKSNPQNFIGFLGRQMHRHHALFNSFKPTLENAGYEIVFFPSKHFGSSASDKFIFLGQCIAVWNVYEVPYNQSGVTGDALMSGTPVIFSRYEPFQLLLLRCKLGVYVDITKPASEILEKLLRDISDSGNRRGIKSKKALKLEQSRFGGNIAFINHWKVFFDSI